MRRALLDLTDSISVTCFRSASVSRCFSMTSRSTGPTKPGVTLLKYGGTPLLALDGVLPGDFDDNGILEVTDIDELTTRVRNNEHWRSFDLDRDGLVNQSDRIVWIEELKQTYFGDANLDGEFDSNDFIQVFTAGEYEDLESGNSTWSEGDWTGDGEFTSADFLLAFQRGGYEQGPRTDAAVVPELGGVILALLAVIGLLMSRREA